MKELNSIIASFKALFEGIYVDENYFTMDDFTEQMKRLTTSINDAYYRGQPDLVDTYTQQLIDVTKLAKRFNKAFGL